MAKELYNCILKPHARATIDNVVKKWYLLLFKDGVSHILDVSATTKVGILFSVCKVALIKKGQLVFTKNNTVSWQQTNT